MIAQKNKDAEVDDLLFSFSALFRYTMAFSDKDASFKEEVEIAKHYSTAKSGSFVNGMLDSIVKNLRQNGKLDK